MACEDNRHICFACVVGKNLQTPNLSPMADDAITRGGINVGGLESPVHIYADHTQSNYKELQNWSWVKVYFWSYNSITISSNEPMFVASGN